MGNKFSREQETKYNVTSSKSLMNRAKSMFTRDHSGYTKLLNEEEDPPQIPPRYVNIVAPELPSKTHPDQIRLIDL